jgi:hypothetical protein
MVLVLELKNKIKKIVEFFDKTFESYSFERMIDYKGNLPWTENDFNKFYKHNIDCIKKLSYNDIIFLDILIYKIKN